eukprot:m.90762 g.90762  ORF g.90762 m.90762 type:complete len:275 (+) comp13279_c0_seq1:214-1038(+)
MAELCAWCCVAPPGQHLPSGLVDQVCLGDEGEERSACDTCYTISCCVASPALWVLKSIEIFVAGCACVYCGRSLRCCHRQLCCVNKDMSGGCCIPYQYVDHKFPPKPSSLGKFKNMSEHELLGYVDWVRAKDLFPAMTDNGRGDCTHADPCFLFEGKIEPNDIDQGELGDCWLMTALSCLANSSPQAIINLFVTREYNERGKYIVRLYDGVRERWRLITIDDYIPCHKNSKRPIFAKPHGFITVHYFFVLILCCRKRIMGRIIGEGICKNAWRI